jgi:hypothetical protein
MYCPPRRFRNLKKTDESKIFNSLLPVLAQQASQSVSSLIYSLQGGGGPPLVIGDGDL